MALRIHDSVVRGELDNRVKGVVKGEIWLEGIPDPILLDLTGNACADLAGCLLTFVNPQQRVPHPHLNSLQPLQRGSVGDLTASRKVRVFDIPLEDALEWCRRGEKPPEHMANCLYLEWFSEANGRVVVESTDYELTLSASEWQLAPEDEAQRAKQASAGLTEFMGRLSEAIERHRRGQKDPESEWDEYDYERFFKECDARTDKYGELLDKYGDSEEAQDKIAEEMGWSRDEEEDATPGTSVEEINAICEAAVNEPEPEPAPEREGIDWIRTKSGRLHHPLQHRCYETAVRYQQLASELGLDKSADADLERFLFELLCTAAKLAGALDAYTRRDVVRDDAFTVAALKRALARLHQSQCGLEALAPRKVLPEAMLADARQELFGIREGILRLMDEFRGRA
jgi:hypothetical protein